MFSIALVLFFVGAFAAFILFGKTFTRKAKESIQLKVFLVDYSDPNLQNAFIDSLVSLPYILQAEYVSKEEAGQQLLQNTGEEVSDLLGGINPLLPSLNIRLASAYLNTDSLVQIKTQLNRSPVVSEVIYPLEMIQNATENINLLSVIFTGVGILLLIIAFYLITGTIRLSIYAQRLSIYTMQLIGATSNFIRKPFLLNGLLQGFLSGILACILLLAFFKLMYSWLDEAGMIQNFPVQNEFIGILIGIVLFGAVLGILGSYLAVNRYLHRNIDELL